MNRFLLIRISFLLFIMGFSVNSSAQKPHRVGTTTANFLEIGYGSAGSSMGDAYVSIVNDLSAVYWNPAGLGYMEQNEALFLYQPWLVDIYTSFAGIGLVLPRIGTLAVSILQMGYGDIDVTTLKMQEGTGEKYTANDIAINISYARKLAQWFAFGGTAKYISSKIWHSSARAFAVDLGVIVNTNFFSFTNERMDGMKIGMCISNYGTKMRFDGMDLLNYVDILPYEEGNYKYVPGQFKMDEWELPLIFRLGIALDPLIFSNQRITIAVDALHCNNNSEFVNIGAQYKLNIPTTGTFYLRGGYKGLFLEDSEFGLTFGGGMVIRTMYNNAIKFDYGFRDVGVFGKTHSYSIGVLF